VKIHEYQAKAVLARYGVPVPRGEVAYNADEAVAIAQRLGLPVIVKAQIHAGGRGKGGGVKLAKTIADVERLTARSSSACSSSRACRSRANCTWGSCSTAPPASRW
jgi:succinyl-CoA synthetase beta subunit